MSGLYAFLRLLNQIASMRSPSAFAKRKARKAGTRATRKVVD